MICFHKYKETERANYFNIYLQDCIENTILKALFCKRKSVLWISTSDRQSMNKVGGNASIISSSIFDFLAKIWRGNIPELMLLIIFSIYVHSYIRDADITLYKNSA